MMKRGTILNFSDFCVKFFVTIIQHFTWKHIIASDIKSFSKLKTIVSYFDHILLKRTWGVVLRPTIYVHNQYIAFLSLFRDILSNIIELTFNSCNRKLYQKFDQLVSAWHWPLKIYFWYEKRMIYCNK